MNGGWHQLLNARKPHWFDASTGRALCGKWLFLGHVNNLKNLHTVKGDCVACARKWQALVDAGEVVMDPKEA